MNDEKSKSKGRIGRLVIFGIGAYFLLYGQVPQAMMPAGLGPEGAGALSMFFAVARGLVPLLVLIHLFIRRAPYIDDARYYKNLFVGNAEIIKGDAEASGKNFAAVCLGLVFFVGALVFVVDMISYARLYGGYFSEVAVRHLLPVFTILTGWVWWIAVLCGLGILIGRMLGFGIETVDDLFTRFWLGLGVCIALLQIWQIYYRITWVSAVVISAIGIFGLMTHLKKVAAALSRPTPHPKLYFALIFTAALFFANGSYGPPLSSDAGLYDFAAIRWVSTFPAVPGIGNLLIQLAYHNASYLFTAMVDQGALDRLAHCVVNNLLMLVLVGELLLGFFRANETGKGRRAVNYFSMLILPPVFIWATGKYATSPSPDLLLYPLGVYLALKSLSFFAMGDRSEKKRAFDLLLIVFMSVLGICIKLSFAVFGFVASACAFLYWLKTTPLRSAKTAVAVGWIALFVVATLGPWMVRGVIMGGYVALPVAVGGFDVDWAVPAETADNVKRIIFAWARDPDKSPDQVLRNWDWFGPWVKRTASHGYDAVLPAALAFFSLVAWLVTLALKKPRGGPTKMAWCLLPSGASILYWFFTAPAIGFEGAAFWVFAVTALALSLSAVSEIRVLNVTNVTIFVAGVWGLCFFLSALVLPGLNQGSAKIPDTVVTPRTLPTGTMVFVPENGLCWDAPLPCTALANPRLALRKPGDLSAGFKLVP